ncbi:MAG: sec-independent protein translocase protein TatC [Gaiellales bacterium]|nr:sec-independent protein translocase protein TatC [Gaiellales bacterium]
MARARRVKPDEQLTLVEHLDELRTRIVVVLAVLTLAVAVAFYKSGAILNFLADPLPHHHGHSYRFLAVSPLDGILTSISISLYSGLLVVMPIASYQLYAFVIPAFAEQHHKHLRPLLLMIPGLFITGVVFAWYLVVPPAIHFLVGYNNNAFNYQLRAKDYIQFVLLTLLAMGIVFEMPVVMLILARLQIMSSALMRRHWRISIVVLAVVAMLLPGVDPISFIVEFIPLLALYGMSYFIVRGVERARGDVPEVEPSAGT